MKHILFPFVYGFLYLLKIIRIGRTPTVNTDGILLVKYGKLGDMYILMNALQKANLDGVKVALPKMYHALINKYFPDLDLLPLYGLRDWSSPKFFSWCSKLLKSHFSKVVILGGSRSPLEEDFIAALQVGTCNTAMSTDSTKIPGVFYPVSDIFYDNITRRKSELELDIICSHLLDELPLNSTVSSSSFRSAKGRIVLVCPGASDFRRAWSINYLDNLLNKLLSEDETEICVLGSETDGNFFREVEIHFRYTERINFQFKNIDLIQLDELVRGASSIITNDSATLHMAVFHEIDYEIHSGFGHYERFCNYKKIVPHDIMVCANCNWSCRYKIRRGEKFPCVQKLEVNGND